MFVLNTKQMQAFFYAPAQGAVTQNSSSTSLALGCCLRTLWVIRLGMRQSSSRRWLNCHRHSGLALKLSTLNGSVDGQRTGLFSKDLSKVQSNKPARQALPWLYHQASVWQPPQTPGRPTLWCPSLGPISAISCGRSSILFVSCNDSHSELPHWCS